MTAPSIIVTGACGFIGFYLVRRLRELGYSVLAVDKNATVESEFLIKEGAEFTALDITQEDEFRKLPTRGVSAFVNLACVQPANMPTEAQDAAEYLKVNALGVANILKYCHSTNVKKLLHTISHRNVQRLWEGGQKITEESPRALKFTGKFALFSISESAASDIIEYYNQQHDMKCVIFRLPSVYGFGHHENVLANGAAVKTGLGVFIENASAGKPIEIWGDPSVSRDVIYVKDVVAAIMLAVSKEYADVCGIFNVASGKALSLFEQVSSIVKVFSPKDASSQIIFKPEKPNSIDACLYDVRKMRKVFGWQPQYSFEDMLFDYKAEMKRGDLKFLLSRKLRMITESDPR